MCAVTYAISEQSPGLRDLRQDLVARLAVLRVQSAELFAAITRTPDLLVALELVYKDNRTPIRKVLKRLEEFVDYKLELAPPDAGAWRANRKLFMTGQWLAATFKLLDRSP